MILIVDARVGVEMPTYVRRTMKKKEKNTGALRPVIRFQDSRRPEGKKEEEKKKERGGEGRGGEETSHIIHSFEKPVYSSSSRRVLLPN